MNQPVFLVGCDRSGTTLLSLLLSQSPDLYMTLESGFIPELYKERKVYNDFRSAKERWYFLRDLQTTQATSKTIAFDIFEMSDDQAENIIDKAAPTGYAGAIDALFSKTAQLNGKSGWGNKTPKYVLHISLLHALFPKARIIHIVRDPRDVAASILKLGWTSTIKEAALYWNKRVSAGIQGRALGNDIYYELKYESLLENPAEETKSIFKWLNIRYQDDFLNSYKKEKERHSIKKHKELFSLIDKPIDKSRAYAWKKTMSKADIAEIEGVNNHLIHELNYEVTNIKLPIRRKIYRWTYDVMLSTGEKMGHKIGSKL